MNATPALLLAPAAAPSAALSEGPAAAVVEASSTAAGAATEVPQEHAHLERVEEIIRVQTAERPTSRRQARAAQLHRRWLQQQARQGAADYYHQLAKRGLTLAEAAERLQLLPRTLRQWDYDCRPQNLALTPLGRWPALADVGPRNAVVDFLRAQGATVGVPRLRQEFPGLARAELAEVLHRCRQQLRQQECRIIRVLHWQVPGSVWAIDFAEPSLLKATWCLPPIDGRCPYLLAVRDLASGCQLAWLPLEEPTAACLQAVLAELFAAYGPPLVLKMDNGPPFRAHDTKAFLEQAGVFGLFSPAACPGYNGSIEASIGSLKKRTEEHARRHGHAGIWTSADVEAARQEANAGHPPRLNGRTPAEVWQRRTPLGDAERVRFELAVACHRYLVRQELHIDQEAQLDHWEQSKVDRHAMQRALVKHDYLLFTRRRIPLTIRSGKVPSDG